MHTDVINDYFSESRNAIHRLTTDPDAVECCKAMHRLLKDCFDGGGKVFLAGNGGSAADSQHIAGELIVRFRRNRKSLPAVALTVDTSVLTACLNDIGPGPVFARQVEGLGRAGDVLWVYSTSGNSVNILEACRAAKDLGMKILAFTGGSGGKLRELADVCFTAPSGVTSHIQECHMVMGHLLCHLLEQDMPETAL